MKIVKRKYYKAPREGTVLDTHLGPATVVLTSFDGLSVLIRDQTGREHTLTRAKGGWFAGPSAPLRPFGTVTR